MFKATYLVRFDDICPTMDWESWEKIEKVLILLNIKPLLAVVPDNQDEKLMFGRENEKFWSRVRKWQELGWSIAIHGYQHSYKTKDPGLMNLNNYSEFSGLSFETQNDYLKKALAIFKDNTVDPDLWIAPAHSFDEVTLKILHGHGIKIISDGFYFRPVERLNMIWIPQQLWKFRRFPFGVWTVCFHINNSTPMQLKKIISDLHTFKYKISMLDDVIKNNVIANQAIADSIFSFLWWVMLKLKIFLKK